MVLFKAMVFLVLPNHLFVSGILIAEMYYE